MPLPDHNTTAAAAFYGLSIALHRPPVRSEVPFIKKPEEKPEEETPLTNPAQPAAYSRNWNEASEEEKAPFLQAARFLSRFCHSGNLEEVNREDAAIALASELKGTSLSGGINHKILVEVYLNITQSLRSYAQ